MKRLALLTAIVGTGVLAVAAVAIGNDGDGSSKNGARLNGYQEVSGGAGSISTTGFGSFHLKFSRDRQSVDYTLSYRNLETAVTQAHIHFAQRSVGGPIAVWLCDGDPLAGPQPPDGVSTPPVCPPNTGGTVHGTFRPMDLIPTGRGLGPGTVPGEWEELLAAIKVGHTYANVHTVGWGPGEIRGQISDRDQKEYTGPPLFGIDDDDGDD